MAEMKRYLEEVSNNMGLDGEITPAVLAQVKKIISEKKDKEIDENGTSYNSD